MLRDVFAERLEPTAKPPANLSLHLAPADEGPTQGLHLVYDTYRRIMRTRSARRAIDLIWRELDGHDRRTCGDAMLLDAAVLVRDGNAHVLPRRLRRPIADNERIWASEGFELVDRQWVELDLSEAVVRVRGGGAIWSVPRQRQIEELAVDDRPVPAPPEGTFPIASWGFDKSLGSPAWQVTLAGQQVLDRARHDGRELVMGLAQMLDVVTVHRCQMIGLGELRNTLSGM